MLARLLSRGTTGNMVPLKRRKVSTAATGEEDTHPIKFPEVVLFLLERKMGASRRRFLTQLARKKGFHIEDEFNQSVTHVVSENNSSEEIRQWLDSQTEQSSVYVLDISWFTESMRAGRPVDILDRHTQQDESTDEDEVALFSVPSYACQRRTSLANHNTALTDALSLLAEYAELSEEEGRGVSFRRAIAVIKVLPEKVTSMKQLRGLPCLGDHTLRVIKDVLINGTSSEAEATRNSQRFRSLKVLTGIFGVGAKTAERWIRLGINDLQQLQESGHTLNRAQQAGLEHYMDLNQPVTRSEADAIGKLVERAVLSILPGAQITLIGGFRRGKPTGHDVDFLITHPEEGKEVGLMPKVVSWLQSKGLLLYEKTTRNSYLESEDGPAQPSSNMDRFERCFSIFKLDMREGRSGTETSEESSGEASDEPNPASGLQAVSHTQQNQESKPWRAVRVDLVVSPISQFAFALLGWTGSKLFERELRRWAGHEKSMSLSSHALYDGNQRRYMRATSEEEIFSHLGLEFIPPSERNA